MELFAVSSTKLNIVQKRPLFDTFVGEGARGSVVVKALCYNQESLGFDT
jgi:hypothetical protein